MKKIKYTKKDMYMEISRAIANSVQGENATWLTQTPL